MPEHYNDWYYEDLPEKAKRAAAVLGYDQEKWDADARVPYDDKKFEECSNEEKRAAMFLHMNPIHKKLDIYWSEVDELTKRHAEVLGWTPSKWDDDWEIEHLECEEWWWADMTEEQKAAAYHFGYSRALWDEEGPDEEDDFDPQGVHVAPARPPPAEKAGEEKKDDETDDGWTKPDADIHAEEEEESEEEVSSSDEEEATAEATAAKPKKDRTKRKKKRARAKFSTSPPFGSAGGGPFNHGNHQAIREITMRTDGHAIHKITMKYAGGVEMSAGSDHGKAHTFTLAPGEFIRSVKVRSNRLVQSLAFMTNKGNTLGPVGGSGWLIGKDKAGEEKTVFAPPNCQLCGISGMCGRYLDQIVFRWGPMPKMVGRK